MEKITVAYTVKSVGLQEYYLGYSYKHDSKGQWDIGCKSVEAVTRVEQIFGPLTKRDTQWWQ
eukprot:7768151-Ditylum_brightwellii.AAC.1